MLFKEWQPGSRRIIRIQVDILGGQVACPEAEAGAASVEDELDVCFAVFADVGRDLVGVEVQRCALVIERKAVELQA